MSLFLYFFLLYLYVAFDLKTHLESFGSFWVVLIYVRMVFLGQKIVGLLDVLGWCVASDAEDLVVISAARMSAWVKTTNVAALNKVDAAQKFGLRQNGKVHNLSKAQTLLTDWTCNQLSSWCRGCKNSCFFLRHWQGCKNLAFA